MEPVPSAQSMKPEIQVEIMQNLICFFLLCQRDLILGTKPRVLLTLEVHFNTVTAKYFKARTNNLAEH